MFRPPLLVSSVACILASHSIAHADQWSLTTEFQTAGSTEVRVVEPEGYQVTLLGRTEVAPAVFAPPNGDDYVVLSVAAPNGAKWEKKIEVRAYRQTVVRIRHVPDAARAEGPRQGQSFVGTIANTSHLCQKASDRAAVRLELVVNGAAVRSFDVAARSRIDASLAPATYQVRSFRQAGATWEYVRTTSLEVTKDGWLLHWGCS